MMRYIKQRHTDNVRRQIEDEVRKHVQAHEEAQHRGVSGTRRKEAGAPRKLLYKRAEAQGERTEQRWY